MVDKTSNNDPANLHVLPDGQGALTEALYWGLSTAKPVSANDALNELTAETVPFNERLSAYVSSRFGINDDVKTVKKCLRQAGEAKGLGFSSANLSQWITSDRMEVNLSPLSIFKLCLAMELDFEESARFVYDCLHQNWLNYRIAEEAIYFYFIGRQDLFGNETYAQALRVIKSQRSKSAIGSENNSATTPSAPQLQNATGYTKLLGNEMRQMIEARTLDKQAALDALSDFLKTNSQMFTGIRRSAIKTYTTYFSEGGIGIVSLKELFHRATSLTLPDSGYLDMREVSTVDTFIDDSTPRVRKRLLWGTENRNNWLKENDRDWDILYGEEIKMEEHIVGEMLDKGIPRGNIIALLFFHFCFENAEEFREVNLRPALFGRFYEATNMTLVDECGMMPLHPRKPFDRLFLSSLACSGREQPIEYLNRMLEQFYSRGS